MTPPNPTLITASAWLLFFAFAGYLAATILYIAGMSGRRMSGGARFANTAEWGSNSHLTGVIFHALAILARWQGAGHWPTSNMYEFIGFMAFTSMLAFQVINRIYRMHLLGAVLSPIGVFLLGYSYVFPPKVAPLVPALKSYWLPLHVSLAALGEGFFAVAFGASLIYLLRVRSLEMQALAAGQPVKSTERERLWNVRAMEWLFFSICVMVGFTVLALTLRYSGFQWVFENKTYHLPPLIGPAGGGVGTKGSLLGLIPMPLLEAPGNWNGKNWNTLLYSIAAGGLIYWLIRRFLTRGPIGDAIAPYTKGNPEMLDEVSYRAVAIGYPVFTLGGLIFAMLWAKEAWGRYWYFDPKETFALITWLVYSAYLHFRITRGWEGRRSAWVVVIGFGVVLFTLVGVNLLIVGLHSYAGGDT